MACDVLAKTVSAVCHSKPSFGWVRFHVRLSTCLNDFHSGLLSKGPEESADGDHDHHLRHHHRHNIHHYHWLWSSGQVGTVSHPKVQTLSNRTPDAQPAIAMEGGAADRNHSGEGQGGTHTTGNHRGEGGRGGLAALHHICYFLVTSPCPVERKNEETSATGAQAYANGASTARAVADVGWALLSFRGLWGLRDFLHI